MDNGALVFDAIGTLTQGQQFSGRGISGSGSLTVAAGAVTLNQLANSFSGNITLNGGTLTATAGTQGLNPGATALGAFNTPRTITVNQARRSITTPTTSRAAAARPIIRRSSSIRAAP